MRNYKQEIITWMIDNQAIVLELIANNNYILYDVDPVFYEEARDQFTTEIQKLVIDEISKALGLTADMFYSNIDKGTFEKYLKEIKNE